jgi:hypothetical protein
VCVAKQAQAFWVIRFAAPYVRPKRTKPAAPSILSKPRRHDTGAG